MPQMLEGRLTVGPGASRGIGAAVTQRFAAEGAAHVVERSTVKPIPSVEVNEGP